MDVIEVEDVLCLFGCGSFLLIAKIFTGSVYILEIILEIINNR